MGKLISLTREECYSSIIDFYKLIASKLGVDDKEVGSYDPCFIYSSKGVFDVIEEYYKNEKNVSSNDFGLIWLLHGCEMNIDSNILVVNVENGFICKD